MSKEIRDLIDKINNLKLCLIENNGLNTIIAYHGTRSKFNDFELFNPKGAMGNPKGIYFTRDLQTAVEYAQDVDGALDDRSRVVKAELIINSDYDGKIINHSYRGEEIVMFNKHKIKILDNNILRKN